MAEPAKPRPFLTEAEKFRDVSRGKPRPYTLKGEAAEKARLTEATWRLEIVSDGSTKLMNPRTLEAGNALDLPTLLELGKTRAVKFLKAMQCNNIATPLGQGLWEGVPLRDVLRLAGKAENVRRLYYHGFHNNDPAQIFQSSLAYNVAMETPPHDLGPFLAYRLNGRPIPLLRGGPVRMVIPWAHGFKSVKWLQKITLTNDYKANDTYALAGNDPESFLKTMARIDDGPATYKAGEPITIFGNAMCGWSGLLRIEYWLRPDAGTHGVLPDDDPAWTTAQWKPCDIEPPPTDWGGALPDGVMPKDVWGFDPATGRPREWPMRYSTALWSVALPAMQPGAYEFRVRAVDRNGFAQPEPRPNPRSGLNQIQCKTFMVV